MKTVLYITASGSTLWCKHREGWRAHDGPPEGAVWVVTNLAEESFSELQIPRLFGQDRQAFIARQLASRFPDTPLRTALPIESSGGLMDRIAPPRQTLLGLDAAPRVNSELDALSAPIAGVWAASMLLAGIGNKASLPRDLFVVFPGPDALRIVFIKNRVPVLSRLIPGITQARDRATEITRTLRHLENTRVVERSASRHAVLVLGDPSGMAESLAADRLDLVDLPKPWAAAPPTDWCFVLFDLALTAPVGQLAPLSRRTAYIAQRLRPVAYATAAVSLALALWAAGDNLRDIAASRTSRNQTLASIQALSVSEGEVEQKMAAVGMPVKLVLKAVTLDRAEIASVPILFTSMAALGSIMGQHEAARLGQFGWRLVPPGQAACTDGASNAAGTVPTTGSEPVQEPTRLVELQFEVTMPIDLSMRARSQTVSSLSAMLAKMEGATMLRDPANELAQAALQGGGAQAQAEKSLSWCMTLPGVNSAPEQGKP